MNLTLLRGFFEQHIFTGLRQGWSLTVEESFYLAAPLLLLGARSKIWRLLLYTAGLLSTGFLLVGLGQLMLNVPVLGSGGFMNSIPFMLSYTFFGRCAEFLVGMALAFHVSRQPPPAASCSRTGPFTLLGVGWITAGTALTATLRSTLNFSDITNYHLCLPIYNFLLPVGIVLLIYGLIYERSWLRSMLETPLFSLLGRSSYAFYLLHLGFISNYISVFLIGHPPIKWVELIILSIAVYWWVEEPLRKWISMDKARKNASRYYDWLSNLKG